MVCGVSTDREKRAEENLWRLILLVKLFAPIRA
jgi:hypothetical protein